MNPFRNRIFAAALFLVMAGIAAEFFFSMTQDSGRELRKDIFGAVGFTALAICFLGAALEKG